ncbi:MAG: xanthine dehydrogenase family protein molybdopterin-binding subunit, partial [Myxococcales bacterium]|nr:xanthine dehydrogenase family protein molybdopterin-binding subunit [Myxococcales bacterium]
MSRTVTVNLGFKGHFKAVRIRLPKDEPAPWTIDHPFRIVGKEIPRIEGADKVTGRARYTSDMRLPGMLYGRVLCASVAAAKIKSIDISEAKKIAGVKAIVILPGRVVRCAGQELGAVAAVDTRTAEDAMRAIKIEYERLPSVATIDAAIKPGAPQVYPGRPNERKSSSSDDSGDVERGFKEADVTVEHSFRTEVQTHSCLEPHNLVASWRGKRLTVWASTQGTFSVRDELARVFRIPTSNVRVITEHMGAGFGSKFGARMEGLLAARLAREAKAPVKLLISRKGEHLTNGNRPSSHQKWRLGVKRDGTLTAMSLHALGCGGIGGGGGVSRPLKAMYDCKNKRVVEHDVFINAGAGRAFRAPGCPQGCFGLEQMIDAAAHKVGMDPVAFRLKNDSHPVRRAELELGAKRIGWERRNAKPGQGQSGPKKRGLGVASSVWYNTGRPPAEIELKIHSDGTIVLYNGAQDIGTGTRTILAQIVAEEMGLPMSAVTVKIGDTSWPFGPGSGGSKTVPCLSPVARTVAYRAANKLKELARTPLGAVPYEDVVFRDGVFFTKESPQKRLSLKAVTAQLGSRTLTVQAERAANYDAFTKFIAGAQFADVEVDVETGVIRVIKIVAVQDCGIVLNRLTARSQINGGVIQGVSFALFEERVLDRRNALMLNPNLEQYKIVGTLDVPEIDAVLFDVSMGSNAAGAVGIGEPVTVPTAAAIANAVYNATGARML